MVADVAFMLDGSGSVGKANFKKVKDFVTNVVLKLNVGADVNFNSRVSVAVFSAEAYSLFSFNNLTTFTDYRKAIDQIPYPGGSL